MKKKAWMFILIPLLLFSALPAGAAENENRQWQDESIYFLIVDRFSNGDYSNDYDVDVKKADTYHGGDFQGVIDKLDYIKDMGFTAIWFNPVFGNEEKGYHGYWINDFYKTDEHLGTIEEFKRLVKEAHKRDLKVILDFPINHVGPNHPWLKDASKQGWFKEQKDLTDWKEKQAVENGFADGLPDLNQDNPDAKNYLINAAKWWINKTDIDGYYLDSINNSSQDFLAEFNKEVKGEKDNFYLLGELRSNNPKVIAKYQETGIDGFIDYPLMERLRAAFSGPDTSLRPVYTVEKENNEIYKNQYLMGTMMDNHNTARFTRELIKKNQHPGPRWKLTLTYMYTTPGIPIVYYGSEIALDGGMGEDNHRIMDFRTDKDLIDYMTKLGELRRDFLSLTRGSMQILAEKDGAVVYKRTFENETTVVAINNTSESQSLQIKAEQLEENKELRGLLSDDLVKSKDGKYTIFIDREEAEIYALAQKSGLNIPYVTATVIVYGAFISFMILVWKRSRKKRSQQ